MTIVWILLSIAILALATQNFFQQITIVHLQKSINHIITFQDNQIKINEAIRQRSHE